VRDAAEGTPAAMSSAHEQNLIGRATLVSREPSLSRRGTLERLRLSSNPQHGAMQRCHLTDDE
jgi:hypothetical protein